MGEQEEGKGEEGGHGKEVRCRRVWPLTFTSTWPLEICSRQPRPTPTRTSAARLRKCAGTTP